MPHPLRDRDPEKIHLITIRTDQAAMWMVPSRKLNEIIGGVVARYQEILGIKLYAYNFLSNHKHLLTGAPRSNLDEFEENVNREIARRVNYFLNRKGSFWKKRYNDQVCIDSKEDGLEALLYTVTNPVHHGLVRDPKSWPGLTCYHQLLDEKPRKYRFTHYTALRRAAKKGYQINIRDFQTEHTLQLSPLPGFEHLSKEERVQQLKELIDQRTNDIIEKRLSQGKSFLGSKAVRRQRPGAIPREIKNSPRAASYSKSAQRVKEFKQKERSRRLWYREASILYRLGDIQVEFPDFTHKPPLHRLPREGPFQPLCTENFCVVNL